MAKVPRSESTHETPATTALSIQVRSTLMRYLYDLATDKPLGEAHYVIRYRRHGNAPWDTFTYRYSDYRTVHASALEYINILQHNKGFELYVFHVQDGNHRVVESYLPEAR